MYTCSKTSSKGGNLWNKSRFAFNQPEWSLHDLWVGRGRLVGLGKFLGEKRGAGGLGGGGGVSQTGRVLNMSGWLLSCMVLGGRG